MEIKNNLQYYKIRLETIVALSDNGKHDLINNNLSKINYLLYKYQKFHNDKEYNYLLSFLVNEKIQ